jgi:amino acid adenylation domain-containing protein/non-ribosomal peptide synthase protein (TIGR01720 family)
MKMVELLEALAQREIKLRAEAGQLRIRAPKGALTDELREGLARNKTELLALLDQRPAPEECVTIPRVSRPKGEAPLSFSQQRLWFLDRLEGQSAAYHIAAAMRLNGPLDRDALGKSLNEIVRRHESLRTTFVTADGQPTQRIEPDLFVQMEVEALAARPEVDDLTARILREIQNPFDLASGPLFRARLIVLSPSEHVLVLVMHHIISDGWSLGILARELAAHYEAFARGRDPALAPLPIQYADYAQWQRRWLNGERLDRQLQYWKRKLAGSPALLELPADRPRSPEQSYRGATCQCLVDAARLRGMNQLCREQCASLFMGLFAVFAVLLSRYTGRKDLVIGTPISNRNRLETEALIGFFANILAVRLDLNGYPSFCEVLHRVRDAATEAYEHQEIPFEQVVDALQPGRNLSHTPIFQVVFAFQNTRLLRLELAGLAVTPIPVDSGTAKFDLTFEAAETDAGLRIVIEYNTDLFDGDRIERMASHFDQLLASVIENPRQCVDHLTLLPLGESEIIATWSEMPIPGDTRESIAAVFERQAASTPEAVAVVFGEERISYLDLNRRANRLARLLAQRGVRSGMLVGVDLERSAQLIVGLLAILKAGAAYVPLDRGYPEAQLRFMVEDAGVDLVIVEKGAEAPVQGIEWLSIADTAAATVSDANLDLDISSEHLAYITYTSGSTGVPKGVAIPHRAVTRLVLAGQPFARFSSEEVFLQLAPVSFDASTLEIWGPLLHGGRLVVMPPALPALDELGRVIEQEAVTTLWLTAGLFHLIVDERIGHLRPLRQLLAGGDVLSLARVQRMQRELPGCAFVNGYGPTENTTFTCCHRVEPGERLCGSVPIGRPIGKTRVYVLDERLQPVGIGMPGELWTGGEGLAWGYWNHPDITAEKFLPDPFCDVPGARIYRTGDLVRFRVDGILEFLGRIDSQVKMRGFRIEPGGIEAALSAHPSVKDAVVVKRETPSAMLAAYVVGKADLRVNELDAFLRSRLPGYMVPAAVVVLDSLPLTANGKVDRAALPEPPATAAEAGVGFVAPRNQTEALLADIWRQVLGATQVGVFDNFFALGGDSIVSIQAVARINQRGLKLSSKDVFEHQTIAELARVVRSGDEPAPQGLVIGPVPLTPIQHWFLTQDWSEPHHFNQSVLLELKIDISSDVIRQVLEEIVVHHDQLRGIFPKVGDRIEQTIVAPGGAISLDTFILEAHEATAQADRIITAIQSGLDLERSPLLRAALFALSDGRKWLFIAVHHLVVDGVSWRILLEDLQDGIDQISRRERPRFPAKTNSFQEWAVRLREVSSSPKFVAEVECYRGAMGIEAAEVPLDSGADLEANTVGSVDTVSVGLETDETRVLLHELPRARGVEVHHALLCALSDSLHGWTGLKQHWINVEGHGRDALPELDVSRTVGWFTAVFPLWIELDPAATAEEKLRSIRRGLAAHPRSGAAYGMLRYLAGERRRNRAPLSPKIAFNYLGQFDAVLPNGSVFGFCPWRPSSDWSPKGKRAHWIEVNCVVINGRLGCAWEYSRNLHRRETIESVASEFARCLKNLICSLGRQPSAAITDFPEIHVTDLEFEQMEKLAGDAFKPAVI